MKAALLGGSDVILHRVYSEKNFAALEALFEGEIPVCTDPHDERLKDAEILFSTWGMPEYTEAEIAEYLPRAKALFYGAGSVQKFARPFLNRGVRLFSAWRANGLAVAQYTYAQILLALKGYFPVQRRMSESRAAAAELGRNYPGAYDVKVGLLGCGAIGSLVAEQLKQADAEVLVFDPFLPDARAGALHVRKTTMEEIFESCDVVSNHLANLPATVGIIRRAHLLSMKPYSTFINTGRGAQLDEKDLYDMLTRDETRTALLDVLTDERHTDENPLAKLTNCFITPHIAGALGLEVRRMGRYMIDAFEQYRDGQPTDCEVSLKMLETMA